MRLGVGPVFASERLTAARRWQYYALRAFGVAAVLVAMGTIAYSEDVFFGGRLSVSAYTRLGRSYFDAMVAVELALVMLAVPAATAGAICLDRSRGALEHLMVTDLSDAEIVLGKLAARSRPSLGLVACCLPVLALSTLLGGIDALALALAFGVIATVALLACAMALTLSIWARRPHEVVLAVYMVWAIAVILHPLWDAMFRSQHWVKPPDWIILVNPFFVALSTYEHGDASTLRAYVGFFAATLAISAVLVLVAVRRLRPAVIGGPRPAQRSGQMGWLSRIRHRLPGPSLDGNPVLWREWHRARAPRLSAMLALLVAGTVVASAAKAFEVWNAGIDYDHISDWGYKGIYAYFAMVLFAGGVLAAVSPMSLSEERRRGSLDVLMTTPIPTRAIVVGKWLSLYRTVPWLAVGPGLLGFALARGDFWWRRPQWLRDGAPEIPWDDRVQAGGLIVAVILVHGGLIISLGLGLATWLRRETRAIGVSITAFVLLAVVWPSLCLVLTESYRRQGQYVAIGAAVSPVYAISVVVSELCRPDAWWPLKMEEVAVCTGGVALASFLILGLTLATFDERMGRMAESRSRWRQAGAPHRSSAGRARATRVV